MNQKPYSSHRKALKLSGTALASLTFQTLGVTYADIGTSPLYTLGGIWPASGPVPSEEDVIGGISAICWSLTLVALIKYVFVTLRFGTTEGEGGTFALYQGLFPKEETDDDASNALTGDSVALKSSSTYSAAERLSPVQWLLLPWALFGTSLVIADGILTPAVSVTSAVGGMAVAKPGVANHVIPISIGFLLAFFLVQRFGVHRIGFSFAPVALLWMLLLGACGIYNICQHPGIFRALDPSRLVMFFVRTKNYDYLAGILLALTGCEAMFANLGQFNKLSIQISFSFFVYPMLILAYLGQGARLIVDGEAVIGNIFYSTIPGPTGGALYWIVFVLAILATLIASQTMVTACFSLIQQLVNLRSLPPIKMIYTSETIQGQVYFPVVNYLLMIACVVVVAAFKNLANLTNAYGFAVSTVMFTTTSMVALQAYYVKHWNILIALAIFFTFGFFDGLFWGASLKKVPHGAWVPLMIGVTLTTIMLFWTWAKGLEDRFDGMNRKNISRFIAFNNLATPGPDTLMNMTLSAPPAGDITFVGSEGITSAADDKAVIQDTYATKPQQLFLVPERDGAPHRPLARVATCAIFHKLTAGRGVPHTFYGFLRQWPALPRVVIFLSVKTMNVNHVPLEDRYTLTKVRTIAGFYGVTYVLGFRDDFNMDVEEIIKRICAMEARMGVNDEAAATEAIEEIQEAAIFSSHIVPHYHVTSKPHEGRGIFIAARNWLRELFLESIYRRIAIMFPETENWVGRADEIIRVGITAEI